MPDLGDNITTTTTGTQTTALGTGTGQAAVALPEGKVFTEDYVKQLREEAKDYRIGKKNVEAKLKELLGLKPEEELDDAKVTAYKADVEARITKVTAIANERLILAEIRSLAEYDIKLLEKLIDRSKITVAEDGTVTGIKEQVALIEAEFPVIKKMATGSPAANPANSSGAQVTEKQQLETQLTDARKSGNTALVVSLRRKIAELSAK